MIDVIVKGAIAAGAAAAAWYADKKIKENTGKHIHEHAVDFIKSLWSRLKNWASKYLAEHEQARKIYLSAVSIAASIKRAQNDGVKFFRMKVFAQETDSPKAKIIKEETVTLDEADAVLQTAKTKAVLAQR